MFITANSHSFMFHKCIVMVQLKGNVISTQSLLVCYSLTLAIHNFTYVIIRLELKLLYTLGLWYI